MLCKQLSVADFSDVTWCWIETLGFSFSCQD